jgi:hypothetical protein
MARPHPQQQDAGRWQMERFWHDYGYLTFIFW